MAQDAFGAVLHSLRAREWIKQGELARQLHVHRNTLGAWERGDYLPDVTIVHEIVRVLQLDERDAGSLLAAHSARNALVAPWNLPSLRNPLFTGREPILRRLHEMLQRAGGSAALCGLGGVGKTQTVLEYAYRFQEMYRSIFWVHAETAETLMASYLTIAELLELPERQETDQSQLIQAVKRWLQSHSGWLVIYDNVEDFNLLEQMVPPAREGTLVLTTRAHATGSAFPSLELEAMPLSESALLLARRGKLLQHDQPLEQLAPQEREHAEELAEQLGRLPLALDQAGAYLEEYGCGLQGYLTLYRTHRQRLLRERGSLSRDHPTSVEATVLLALERVQHRNPAAADVLRFCAFLAPEAIPQELIWPEDRKPHPLALPLARDALEFYGIVKDLLRYSLIQTAPRSRTLSLHRLVQEVLREKMDQESRQRWLERVIRTLNHLFPPLPLSSQVEEWPLCERLLPHVQVALGLSELEQVLLPETAQLCLRSDVYLFERARYAEMEVLARKALDLCTRVYGPEHLETAECLTLLNVLFNQQGKYEEAERLGQQVLAIRERQLGPSHVLVTESLGNLAVTAWLQGHDERAIALLRRAIAAIGEPASWELTYETSVAIEVLVLLARVYASQGNYQEAESLQQRALEIGEQALGPLHPQTAFILTKLGDLYRVMGRYAGAEPLLQQALAILEQQFGPSDPLTGYGLHSLGQLYLEQGRYTEAEQLLQRALLILESIHGANTPDRSSALLTLADLCRLQGKYEQAQAFGERLLQADEQTFGRRHPRVAQSLVLLGMLARDQQRYAEAEALLQEALAIYEERAIPAADPRMTAVLHALGVLCHRQGRLNEAEQFLQRALALREERFGPTHPQVAESLAELAELCCELGRATEADELTRRALSIAEQALGHDHPLTRDLRHSRVQFFKKQTSG